ncbi:MAG: hypothetical protein JEZ04_21195 [Spirochaetales bacterium]|nr:hypothetical protein [Spirochaetales bacterium]
MIENELLSWLLEGDPSIQYQVYRDLLGEEREDIRTRISSEGWGEALLSKRRPDGNWGLKFYQPKWTSTHYTMQDLQNLCVSSDNEIMSSSVTMIISNEKGPDGGINPAGSVNVSDVCINGMFLCYACPYGADQRALESIVDFILSQRMSDGGFNCRLNRSGAVHSSLHTTICTLEGITAYVHYGYTYRKLELLSAAESSKEFILQHRLFMSDKTGRIIHKDFLRMTYPYRWRYDILRAMDYFRFSKTPWDERMRPAVDIILKKRNSSGKWNQSAKLPGAVHLQFEKAGNPGRWNTLRALRVLSYYNFL